MRKEDLEKWLPTGQQQGQMKTTHVLFSELKYKDVRKGFKRNITKS